MTLSIWRFSHLALAVTSFLFLLLASLTGIVLAFEPVAQNTQPFATPDFSEVTLADAIPAIKSAGYEPSEFRVEPNGFVVVQAIDDTGENAEFYTDARSGKNLGNFQKPTAFFEWVRTLHRSLFAHETGRLIMGISVFLLLLIALTGTILVVKRQLGIRRFFSRIIRENFTQYYHVFLGRLLLVPILLIALSGTYLSLVRFEVFPDEKASLEVDFDKIKEEPKIALTEMALLKSIPLSDVLSVEFPFSDDPEDYYTVKLHDRELAMNQYTGEILAESETSATSQWAAIGLDVHTGRASIIWALVLAVASVNILFFIYSGFAMTLRRRSGKIRNKVKASSAEIILLAGSESGSTMKVALSVQKQLNARGKAVFLAPMNEFQPFPKAKTILVLTATYGLGEAPENAKKFLSKLEKFGFANDIGFSVIAFGSHAYKDFCRYGFEVHNALSKHSEASAITEIHTVNDRSPEDISRWLNAVSIALDVPLELPEAFRQLPNGLSKFVVSQKSPLSHDEGAFLLRLKPVGKTRFESGDILNIYPGNDYRMRQYSVGKYNGEVQLAVKLHGLGLGSRYLFGLEEGDKIQARIQRNPSFHFPKKARKVILISNGTGIAPFLGMIASNRKTEVQLYAGFRNSVSYGLYEAAINGFLADQKLSEAKIAFSREGEKMYVRDLLERDAKFILATLELGETVMLCGSLAMQENVLGWLSSLLPEDKDLGFYQSRGQILMDCY